MSNFANAMEVKQYSFLKNIFPNLTFLWISFSTILHLPTCKLYFFSTSDDEKKKKNSYFKKIQSSLKLRSSIPKKNYFILITSIFMVY